MNEKTNISLYESPDIMDLFIERFIGELSNKCLIYKMNYINIDYLLRSHFKEYMPNKQHGSNT